MTDHRKAIELLEKTVVRRRNRLQTLLAERPVNPRQISIAEIGIQKYSEAIDVLRKDEEAGNAAGQAYSYSSAPVGNEDRAGWALEAVRHYAKQNRFGTEAIIDDGDTEHLDEVLGDLMNDLLHLTHQSGLDPEVLIDRARRGYEEERLEEEQTECARCGDPISEADDAATGEVCGDCKMQIENAGSEAEQAQYDFPWAKDGAR